MTGHSHAKPVAAIVHEGELTHLPDVNATAPWVAEAHALEQAQHNGLAHGHDGHTVTATRVRRCPPATRPHWRRWVIVWRRHCHRHWRWPSATPPPRRFTAPSRPRLRALQPVATAAASVQLPDAGPSSFSLTSTASSTAAPRIRITPPHHPHHHHRPPPQPQPPRPSSSTLPLTPLSPQPLPPALSALLPLRLRRRPPAPMPPLWPKSRPC